MAWTLLCCYFHCCRVVGENNNIGIQEITVCFWACSVAIPWRVNWYWFHSWFGMELLQCTVPLCTSLHPLNGASCFKQGSKLLKVQSPMEKFLWSVTPPRTKGRQASRINSCSVDWCLHFRKLSSWADWVCSLCSCLCCLYKKTHRHSHHWLASNQFLLGY